MNSLSKEGPQTQEIQILTRLASDWEQKDYNLARKCQRRRIAS